MDHTLVDAVEKILAYTSKPPSASSSRSRTRDIPVPTDFKIVDHVEADAKANAKAESKKFRDRSDSDAYIKAHKGAVQEVHRNECKKMILGALEDVIRSMREELSLEEEENSPFLRRQKARRERANLLREGVRGWLMRAGGAEAPKV